MDQTERENQIFLAAVALYEKEVVGDTYEVGSLRLAREGDCWRVHHVDEDADGGIVTYADTIRPTAFWSARYLGTYLQWLDEHEAKSIGLVDDPSDFNPTKF